LGKPPPVGNYPTHPALPDLVAVDRRATVQLIPALGDRGLSG